MTVQSAIGAGATVRAEDDVSVIALSRKNVQTYALSIGGGFVGAAGAVSVWSVGTQSTTTYDDDGGGETKGPWSSGTKYGKGDVVTHRREQVLRDETTRRHAPHAGPDRQHRPTGTRCRRRSRSRRTRARGAPARSTPRATWSPFGGDNYVATATIDDGRLAQNPTVNTTDWDLAAEDEGGGDAVSDSDDVAKGDGGYKDAVERRVGARRLGAWTRARSTSRATSSPSAARKYVGEDVDDRPARDARTRRSTPTATGTCTSERDRRRRPSAHERGLLAGELRPHGAAPSDRSAGAATGGSRPLPLGTVAVVNGTIIAGGNALVRAKDDIKAQGSRARSPAARSASARR